MNLTDEKASLLRNIEKHRLDEKRHSFPSLGGSLNVPLISFDHNHEFFLDVTRSRLKLSRTTFQNRALVTEVLVRLDLHGPPHRNPNGKMLPCPHIHLYKEGFGDKWAYPLPEEFRGLKDDQLLLDAFLKFCNVTRPPHVDFGLGSFSQDEPV